MNEPMIHFEGNATGDPELRYSKAGKPWCAVNVAVTPRDKDTQGNWTDGATMFFRCKLFGTVAENVADSISKGDRVHVSGRLRIEEYETEHGKRTSNTVIVDELCPSLKWATATVTRKSSGNSAGFSAQTRDTYTTQAPVNNTDAFSMAPPF